MKYILLIALLFASCEKDEENKPSFSNEKRGNGNGNQSNPCQNNYQVVYSPLTDFNVNADTSNCGTIILTWQNQPNFTTTLNPCFPLVGSYLVSIQPVGQTTSCGGSYTFSNSYYYTYGSGCSMFTNKTYDVTITYIYVNDQQQIQYWNSSIPYRFTTGSKYVWQCP